MTVSTSFQVIDDSIVISARVNGEPIQFILDTGDAIGPTFTADDAERLGLREGKPLDISGAGGASTAYETTANIEFDEAYFPSEPGAIDTQLQDDSLLGLPFFIAKAHTLEFDFDTGILTIERR